MRIHSIFELVNSGNGISLMNSSPVLFFDDLQIELIYPLVGILNQYRQWEKKAKNKSIFLIFHIFYYNIIKLHTERWSSFFYLAIWDDLHHSLSQYSILVNNCAKVNCIFHCFNWNIICISFIH